MNILSSSPHVGFLSGVRFFTSVISFAKAFEIALFYFFKNILKTPEIYLSKRPKNYKGEEQRFRAILTRGEVLLIIENRIHFRQIPAYVLTE